MGALREEDEEIGRNRWDGIIFPGNSSSPGFRRERGGVLYGYMFSGSLYLSRGGGLDGNWQFSPHPEFGLMRVKMFRN